MLNYVRYILSWLACLVLYVLSCLTCLVPYVLSCPTCLVPYVLSFPTCLVSYELLWPTSLVPHVLCASHASCPMWPRASRFMSLFSLHSLLSRTLRTLFPNITFFALEFPCLTPFFCSFTTCDFLEGIY